ncbi:dynein associated protein-domain-containing protein [Podospora aff. communis PSN243]|uniref:Dynein associated protein-domain-containing protein n=1 Tax=Podospora aff. communis PSN243 TaxID=3040156 RepID=A0AAV9H185_9PEZI|nr:dynein associated protein-domain-containing protein [Podospora aff. communis PSN243]
MSELALGQKIQLSDGRTGFIRFIGQTGFAAGDWVGIELDDGSGKNDGSVQGERYFDCPMGSGMFVRPATMTVVAQPPPKPAAIKRSSRPSSMLTSGPGSRAGPADAGLSKRMSLNAPSPSPGPKSRPSSLVRSPTKSPTKQLATASSSAATSRTGTPSNAKPLGTKPRASIGGTRTSMPPPPIPAPKPGRQVSGASSTGRSAVGVGRTLSGRLPSTSGRPGLARPVSGRNISSGSLSIDNSSARNGERGAASPLKSSDDEILSPQPTSPVQARTQALERLAGTTATSKHSPTAAAPSARPTATATAAQKEIEDLKAKLRVLEKKRMDDREKLNSLERIQGERDKFERIIQTLQIKYQPQGQEIIELKKQLKEAESRLYNIEDIQAEHESAMELATLDREMAEETAEMLKVELETLRQKTEELELEVEILREENSEFTKGMSPEERASTGWLQMERNNERLREALIRLRDISQQNEEELKDQVKVLEADLRELETVKDQYTAATEKLAQTEAAVEDLREQLNNALGAEDLIETLTEQTMNQAEEIKELKAVISDLEDLKEINDELEINHVQNEREMQEELDLRDSIITEQVRQAAAQKESMDDMEYTLSRFRELVTSLQSDLEDMRASHAVTENESEQLNSRSRAMMDLNMKLQISAAKAQVKTIDLELRRMEAQEAEQHLEIVKLFLPDTYQSDRDSVLALLRFKRLAFKANLLNNFLKEKVNGQPHPGHEDDMFEGCGAIDKLTWVSSMCDRFVNAISHCSLEQFAQFEGALYELEPVERALNGWIDGLRRDDLKEKQCSAELQRTIALMSHLGEVHISNDLESFADDIHMRALLMQSHLESAAVTFTGLRGMVQRVVPENEDEDELAQYFSKKVENVVGQTRSTKVIAGKMVRSLEDLKLRSLSLQPETAEAFETCESATQELAEMARKIGLELHRVLHEEGRTEPYTYAEVQNCVQRIALTSFSSSESDLFSTYMTKLRVVTSQISDIAALSSDLTQTQEFERSVAPWILRSQELKALKTVPVDAEEELRRLKEAVNDARRAIAVREESLSTAQVRIETLESRMRDANAKASRIVDLEAQIAAAKQEAAGLRDDIQKQDRELKALEADRDKWKKIASDSRVIADAGAEGEGSKARQERAVATAREMNALKDEIAGLQSAVRYLREDNRRARVTEQPQFDWLAEPLTKPTPPAEQRKASVMAEGKVILGELVKLATNAKVYSLESLPKDKLAWRPAKSTPQYHVARQMEDFATWKSWQDALFKKSQLLTARPSGVSGAVAHGIDGAKKPRAPLAAARLRIRLPVDGKLKPGVAREVQIVGSREWEGLQGRLAVV